MNSDKRLHWEPMVRRLIIAVAVLCALAPPVLYLLFALNEQKVGMEAGADILAHTITDQINKNPEYWTYEDIRFSAILRHRLHKGDDHENRQLFDSTFRVVAENKDNVQPPLRSIEVGVYDAGEQVGFLRITRSTRSILLLSALTLLAGSICGFLVYFVLHSFPLKMMKAAFTALHAEKEQATITLQSISDAVIATDTSWRILSLNHAASQMAGVQPAGAIGTSFRKYFEIVHPETGENVDIPLEDCLQSHRRPCHLREQVVLRRADGAEFQVELTVSPLHDEKAGLMGFVIVLHDVTASRSLAEELREKVLKLVVIVRYAGVGIAFVKGGVVQEVNAMAGEIIGLPPEAIIGKQASSILNRELGYTESLDSIYELLARGEIFDIEHQVVRSDRKRIWLRLIGQAVDPARLREGGSVWITQDITALKQQQEELRMAKIHAEAANNFKSEFLAHVSHELRSPMSGVLGMNRLILETDLTPEQRRYVTIVQTSAETMLLLINNLLDLSKIEAGVMELEEKPFRISSVYNYINDIMAFRIREKGLSLTFAIGEDVPPVLIGDELRLGQVILNLVGNAMKFTSRGGIDVLCERVSSTDSTVLLRFKVTDTGCGIDESARQKIFDAFVQASSSVARTHGGSGLGLSICRKLTALMGGDIEVASEPGRGSTFAFTARFRYEREDAAAAAGEAPAAASEELCRPPLRILLVEDVPFNQTIAKLLLEREGHNVRVAMNGREALAALAKSTFDVIFLDIQMPVMDGLETARLIRRCEMAAGNRVDIEEDDELLRAVASGIGGGRLPIIAMTGNATEADRSACIAAGMDDYLSKPFDDAEMMRVLGAVRCGKRIRSGDPSSSEARVRSWAGITASRTSATRDNRQGKERENNRPPGAGRP